MEKNVTRQNPVRAALRSSSLSVAIFCVVGSVVLLLILFHTTTPLSAGPMGILVVFTLIYLLCVALAFLVLRTITVLISRLKQGTRTLTARKAYYVASVLGFIPVLYLTLASMGGISAWGITLIVLFVSLSLFYVLRRL